MAGVHRRARRRRRPLDADVRARASERGRDPPVALVRARGADPAFSWAFFEEFALEAGESFEYRYRVVVADGAWDREQVATRLKGPAW